MTKNKFFIFVFIQFLTILFICSCNNEITSMEEEFNIKNKISNKTTQNIQTDIQNKTISQEDKKKEFIYNKLNSMTLDEKIGQLFMIALRKDANNEPILNADKNVKDIINLYKPGGFILFGENIDTVEQTQNFIYDLQDNSIIPMFIGIDEEGGRVSRLQKSGKIGATVIPPNKVIGDTGTEKLAYEVGNIIGKELSVLGFNMNFAPVADINTNPKNPVIGDRAFSSDSLVVSKMVIAQIKGIQQNNISSVIKHFPGHGDTQTDTHTGSTYLNSSLEQLREVELIPFKNAIYEEKPDGIMVSHIILPNITNDNKPSSMSETIVTDILKNDMKYDGLIITDALDMAAITNEYTSKEVVFNAIQAGIDILLMPQNINEAYNYLYDAVKNNYISQERIDKSVIKILSLKYDRNLFSKKQINKNAINILGCEEHLNIINNINLNIIK